MKKNKQETINTNSFGLINILVIKLVIELKITVAVTYNTMTNIITVKQ